MTHTYTFIDHNIHYSIPYEIIKSSRRSIAIEVKPGGIVLVRIPRFLTESSVVPFLEKKREWLLSCYLRQKDISPPLPKEKTKQELLLEKRYREAAADYLEKRAAYYVVQTGGHYHRITIRDQKTRWGSCSSKGTLSFNWRLILAPPRVLDYVVIHELCHLTYMNHGKDFWNAVSCVMPDYKIYRDWLKKNGNTLYLH